MIGVGFFSSFWGSYMRGVVSYFMYLLVFFSRFCRWFMFYVFWVFGGEGSCWKKKFYIEGFFLDFGSSMCYGIFLLELILRCVEEGVFCVFFIFVLLIFWVSLLLVL